MPLTPLARVRAAWPGVAGSRVAAQAEPVSEREGVITVACRSAVWAQELDLLSGDLTRRLEAALAGGGDAFSVRGLRFVTRSSPPP